MMELILVSASGLACILFALVAGVNPLLVLTFATQPLQSFTE